MPEYSLNQILGDLYYAEALRCAHASRWEEARLHLNGMEQLLPDDHRPALTKAKICLQLGRRQEALDYLVIASGLGHDPSSNQAMISQLLLWDDKRRNRRRRAIRRRKAGRSIKRTFLSMVAAFFKLLCSIGRTILNVVRRPKPQTDTKATDKCNIATSEENPTTPTENNSEQVQQSDQTQSGEQEQSAEIDAVNDSDNDKEHGVG